MSTGTKAMKVIAAVSAEPSETESACSGLYVAPRNSCDWKLLSGATEQDTIKMMVKNTKNAFKMMASSCAPAFDVLFWKQKNTEST